MDSTGFEETEATGSRVRIQICGFVCLQPKQLSDLKIGTCSAALEVFVRVTWAASSISWLA